MQLWNSILGRGAKWRMMMMMIRRRGVTFPGTLAEAKLLFQYSRLLARHSIMMMILTMMMMMMMMIVSRSYKITFEKSPPTPHGSVNRTEANQKYERENIFR